MQPLQPRLQLQAKTRIRRQGAQPAAGERIGFLASITFILLSIILFCNVNGIVVMIWDINRAASAFILAFCLIALALLARHVMPSLHGGANWLLIFFFCYMAFGAVMAFQSPFIGLPAIGNRVLSYGASVVIIITYSAFGYLLVRSGRSGVRMTRLLFFICCISTLSVLLGVVYPAWTDITKSVVIVEGRYSGFFGNPNEVGLQASLTVVVGSYVSLRTGRLWYFVVAVVCAGIASFYSFSKTAILLSMTVSTAMAFLMQRRGLNVKNVFALIASTALVVILVGYVRGAAARSESTADLTSGQVRRLEQVYSVLFEGRIDEETTTGRTLALAESLDIWKQSPLVGNGLTTMDRLPIFGLGPHNTFAKVLGETGLIGFLLLVAALARLAMHALHVSSASVQALVAGSLIVLFGGFMVSHNVLDDRNHNAMMGLMCGMAAGAPLAMRRSRPRTVGVQLQPVPYRRAHAGVVRG